MSKETFCVLIVIIGAIIATVIGSCRYQRQVDKLIQDYRIELQNQNRR